LSNNHENQSNPLPQGSLENSIVLTSSTVIASYAGLLRAVVLVSHNDSKNHSEVLPDWNPLVSAVIKIREILSAATVTTGANTSLTTLERLRYLPIASIHLPSKNLENVALSTINGEATIYSRKTPILAISTSVSATRGKIKAIATAVLMINIHEVSPIVVVLSSVSCAKLSNEA
jgi:hypothetical protein